MKPEKEHGNVGNQNAVKVIDQRLDIGIHFRGTQELKNKMVKAAQASPFKKLSPWLVDVIERELRANLSCMS